MALTIAIGLGVLLTAPDGHAQSEKMKAAFDKDLQESGLTFKKVGDKNVAIYLTQMKRKQGQIDVVVGLAENNTVFFQTLVAAKGTFKITPDIVQGMLTETMNADFVKVGFTPPGDLVVRYDIRLTAIDGDEVKFLADTVADFAADIAERLRAANLVK